MKKHVKRIYLSTALISGIGLFMVHVTESGATKQHLSVVKPAVKTITPRLYEEKNYVTLPATVVPIEQVNIYPRADGYIEKRFVDIGQEVHKGQILAKISSPELEEQLKQAKADIRKQEAVVALTAKLKKRYEKLRTSGVVSITDLDEKDANYSVAQALLHNYQARLKQLKANYAYTDIVAPFSGVITQRKTEVGDRVSAAGHEKLFTIANQQKLKIIVHIPQGVFNRIDIGKNAKFFLSDDQDANYRIKYLQSSDNFDNDTGTMRVEYQMNNKNKLPSGLTGDVKLVTKSKHPLLAIPLNSIRMVNGKPAVMVLKSHKISEKTIKIQRFTKQLVIISAGIDSHDEVIVNPNALLQKGDTAG